MKTMKIFNFSDVFNYATEHYDIGWNECNDVFFGNSLEYQRHTEVYPGDWVGYVSFYKSAKKNASDYTKEEVKEMSAIDKSYVVLSAYFESLSISDCEVLVDCT